MIYTDGKPTIANYREQGPNFPRAAVGGQRPPHPSRVTVGAAPFFVTGVQPQGYVGYRTWSDPVGRAAGAYDEPTDAEVEAMNDEEYEDYLMAFYARQLDAEIARQYDGE